MRHLNIHDEVKQFVCSLCQKGFNQKVHLKRHIMVHSGEKYEKCSYCEKSFTDKSTMERHIRMTHMYRADLETGKYKCDNCQKMFKTRIHENHHKFCGKLMYGETSIICRICEQDLTTLKLFSISLHVKCHQTNAETYKCGFCEQRFSQKSNKKTHENNIHKKINQVSCKICQTSFGGQVRLENHIKSQHQVGEYKCTICPSSFVAETKLKIHLEYHNCLLCVPL